MDANKYPPSLQGILRYAIANSKAEDVDPERLAQMDVDRKQFLENAIKSMTIDVVEELEKAVRCLESKKTKLEEKVEALNVIRDYSGNIDFANNFIQIGGSKVVLDCLNSNKPKLKICAAYVIAELSQNNPYCQKHFLKENTLQMLILCSKDDGDIASSAMHAISSLVRNFEEGCAKFIELDGIECILERMHSQYSNVFVKSCFLLRALAVEYTALRDKFVERNAITKLSNFVEPVCGFDIKIEIVLSALIALTETTEGKKQLQRTNISSTLKTIVETNDGKAECEEILRDSANLLKIFEEKL